MEKRNAVIIFFIILIAVLAAGCGGKTGRDGAVSTVRVETAAFDRAAVASGKLEAIESASVIPKVPGKVAAVNVDVGSVVSAGDVLVQLEANEAAASVSQARAAVGVASSGKEQALSDYEVAKANYERGKALLAQGAISQSDFENKFELPYRKAEEYALRGAGAQLSQALAALQYAEANYANSIIKSPISGVVTAKNINVGELAGTASPVVTVVNLDKVVVQASVGEDMINDLKAGDILPVKVAAASPEPFQGVVTNIALAANPATKAYPVKIQIDNPGHLLKPGMFAEVLLKGTARAVPVVPKEAIVVEGGKNYVWVLENGVVHKREVVTGQSDGVKVAVTSGLSGGQEVVVTGLEGLQEGQPVNVSR